MKITLTIITFVSCLITIGSNAQSPFRVGMSHELGGAYLFTEWDDTECLSYSPGLYFRIGNDIAITAKTHLTIGGTWGGNETNEFSRDLRLTNTPFMLGVHWGAGTSHFNDREFGIYSAIGWSNLKFRIRHYNFQSLASTENYTIRNFCWEIGVNIMGGGNLGIYCIPPNEPNELSLGFTLRFGPIFIRELIAQQE